MSTNPQLSDASSELLKIGEVARRTGLTPRALRYYEELGLLPPSARQAGGHRVYDNADLERLYRICLLRQLGTPLAEMRSGLDDPTRSLAGNVASHLDELDARMAALGRLRERVGRVADTLQHTGALADRDLLEMLEQMGDVDSGVRRRITLLVYADIPAAHDFLVTVFGLGPGPITYDEDGTAVHGVLTAGDGLIWLHPEAGSLALRSPRHLGGSTGCMAVFVDDLDRHFEAAVAAGAQIVEPPRPMPYGVREYDVHDCEGGLWSFMQETNDQADDESDDEGADDDHRINRTH